MLSTFAHVSSLLAAGCYACDPGHGSKLHAKRQLCNFTTTAFPSRELIWNDVNCLATTDSHGWSVSLHLPHEGESQSLADLRFLWNICWPAIKNRLNPSRR
jgi:hypothetical protein